jgi:hypothetical protein
MEPEPRGHGSLLVAFVGQDPQHVVQTILRFRCIMQKRRCRIIQRLSLQLSSASVLPEASCPFHCFPLWKVVKLGIWGIPHVTPREEVERWPRTVLEWRS